MYIYCGMHYINIMYTYCGIHYRYYGIFHISDKHIKAAKKSIYIHIQWKVYCNETDVMRVEILNRPIWGETAIHNTQHLRDLPLGN